MGEKSILTLNVSSLAVTPLPPLFSSPCSLFVYKTKRQQREEKSYRGIKKK